MIDIPSMYRYYRGQQECVLRRRKTIFQGMSHQPQTSLWKPHSVDSQEYEEICIISVHELTIFNIRHTYLSSGGQRGPLGIRAGFKERSGILARPRFIWV